MTVIAAERERPSTFSETAAVASASSRARRSSSSASPSSSIRSGSNTLHLLPEGYVALRSGNCSPMKLLYKPFGLLLGVMARLLSRRLFGAIWGQAEGHDRRQGDRRRGAPGRRFRRRARGRRPRRRTWLRTRDRRLAGREGEEGGGLELLELVLE